MRYPVAGLFFLIVAFMLFIGFAVGSYLLENVDDAFDDKRAELDDDFGRQLDLLKNAFGFIGVLCLLVAIAIFVLDSLADEPEEYWRGPE